MLVSVMAAAIVLAVWSLLAGRLERWRVTAPMVLVLAGAVVGLATHSALAQTLNTDTAQPLTVVMWFAFGALTVVALAEGVPWGILVFCLLALTVVRMLPVLVAMRGSQFTWPERLLLGWSGPPGTTSIVFGLLTFNVLTDVAEQDALLTMVVVVLASVVVHGHRRASGRTGIRPVAT